MDVRDILTELARRRVTIRADGDTLRVRSERGALTPGLRDELTARKPEILAFLHGRELRPDHQSIEPVPRGNPLPLSLPQEWMWYWDQVDPQNAFLHLPFATRLKGNFRRDVLSASLDDVVRRHEVLRTTFADDGSGVRAHIHAAPSSSEIPLADLSHLPVGEREAEALRLLTGYLEKIFVVGRGPLFRTMIFRLDDREHWLVGVMHHLIADMASTFLIQRELFAIYEARLTGTPALLPELPVQYADYAAWQRRVVVGEARESLLRYWRDRFADAPAAPILPTDRRRPRTPTRRGGTAVFAVPAELTEVIDGFCRARNVSLFTLVIAALDVLLHRCSGQTDIVLGCSINGRSSPELAPLIGNLGWDLGLRSDLSGDPSFGELLDRVGRMVLEAFRHQEVPVAEVFRSMRTDRSGTFDPFFNVMLTLFVQPAVAEAGGLQITPLDVWLPHGTLYYDLFLGWVQIGKRLYLLVDYAEDLFGIDTIRVLFDAYRDLLEACTRDTDARLSTLPISALLRAKAQASEEPPLTLTVAATFTAEPVEASLQFWSDELGCSWRLVFSPYNQVFQQLLDAGSDSSRNPNGINVLLVRLADLIASGDSDGLDREIAQLIRAVSASRAPVLLLVCPSSPEDGGWAAHENGLSTTLRDTPGVHVMIPAEIDALYAVTDAHDPYADALGHIPYRPEYYAVLGTLIARHVHAAKSKPRKVIAVDCDNTLWGGVCAEVGPEGVELEAGHRALQEFLVAQHDQGMLLCLCSKNEGADVRAVFDQRPEMPLRLEQIAFSRIDWQPKSGNLRSLARQLNVGLESFVFIDDNPLECAEVRANCPEVVVLPVPEDAGRVPDVLRHLWALDRLAITLEDRQRTAFYRCEADRERFRQQAPSLAEFLERLDLQIEISEMVASQVARVAQLTQRTNQFNTTSWRLSEAELADLCSNGGRRCLVTSVRDRFGDHGLVGAAIFADDGDALRVEGFLQSCRTLGRGVEHRMLSALGERAQSAGKRWVDLPVVVTVRNRPVREFLEGIGGSHADGGVVRFDAATAAVVRFDPHGQERLTEVTGSDAPGPPEEDSRAEVDTDPETLVRIAYELSRPGDIFAAVSRRHQERTGRKPGDPSTFVAPRNPDEEALTRLWADLLGVEQVGIHDDFFSLGGDSIVAIQMTGRARTAGLSLAPADLLTHKTVASLVALARG